MTGGSRLTKPWQELTADNVSRLRGQLGVYQLAGSDGDVVLIGYAGGRSIFGLRGELGRALEQAPAIGATQFRVEVTMAYWSRYKELLMLHLHDHGRLPAANHDDPSRLGRLSP